MSKPQTAARPAGLPTAKREFRERICRLEDALLACPDAVTELPVLHHFASHVYVRELQIPADTVLTGRIHKHDCVNIVIGDIEVATEEGTKRLTGLNVFRSPAGLKRAGHTFSATIWLTVHANPTDERDGTRMADRLTVPSFDELEGLAPHPTKQLED